MKSKQKPAKHDEVRNYIRIFQIETFHLLLRNKIELKTELYFWRVTDSHLELLLFMFLIRILFRSYYFPKQIKYQITDQIN